MIRTILIRGIRRRLAERRAIAAVEFALIAPLMLLFLAGIVETGALLRAYTAVNRLTMQFALSYADCNDTTSGACQSELTNYTSTNALSNVVPQLNAANLTLRMFQVKMNGATPTVVYAYPVGASPNSAETAAAAARIQNGQDGVVVSTTYQHTLQFFGNIMTPYFASHLSISYVVAQIKNQTAP